MPTLLFTLLLSLLLLLLLTRLLLHLPTMQVPGSLGHSRSVVGELPRFLLS